MRQLILIDIFLAKFKFNEKHSKSKINQALGERVRSFALGCSRCFTEIKPKELHLRIDSMDFCNRFCYTEFLKDANINCCASCKTNINDSAIDVNLQRAGNDLVNFCSQVCSDAYLEVGNRCKFCQTKCSSESNFCSNKCQVVWNKLYGVRGNFKTFCTECNHYKFAEVSLLYDKDVYEFCSFACFFYLKTYAAVFPGKLTKVKLQKSEFPFIFLSISDQCTVCQTYFIRDSKESITLRFQQKVHVFCSQSCCSHFVHKYGALQQCCLCQRPKTNFDMVKFVNDDVGTPTINYCSVRCMQLLAKCDRMFKVYNAMFQKQSTDNWRLMNAKITTIAKTDVWAQTAAIPRIKTK